MGMNVPVTPSPPTGYVAPSRPRAWSAASLARWSLVGAAAATLVAFVARVWALGDASLWYDEAYSVAAAAKAPLDLFATIIVSDNNPPLHHLILSLGLRLFGNREFAVRFVSLIPGVLLVPLAYATGAEVFRGHPYRRGAGVVAGLSAAILVSLSPYLIFYAQEARMYSQLALFALLAVWTLLWATRSGPGAPRGVWPWASHGAAMALMLYSHYAGVLLLPALAAYALLCGGRALGRWLLALAFGLLLWLPWLPSALAQVRRFGTTPEYFPARLQFGDVLGQIVTRFLGVAATPLAFTLAGALLLAALLALVSLWRTESVLARRVALLVLAAALPMLLTAGLATVIPKFVPRYAIVATPALLVAAPSVLVALLWNRRPAGRVIYGVALALTLLGSVGGAWQAAHAPFLGKDDVRGLARYITERAKPEQAVLHIRGTPEAFDYYYRGAAPRYAMDVGFDFTAGAAKLNQVLATQPSHIWLPLWQNEFTDPTGMVITELTRRSHKAPLVRDNFSGYHLMRFEMSDWTPVDPTAMPTQPIGATFEDQLTLVGADRLPDLSGGLGWVLTWTADRPLDRDYSATLQLVDADGQVRLTRNQALITPYLSATGFPVGLPLRGLTQLTLPADLAPGAYDARLLVWDTHEQRNLGATDAAGRHLGASISLGRVDVPTTAAAK